MPLFTRIFAHGVASLSVFLLLPGTSWAQEKAVWREVNEAAMLSSLPPQRLTAARRDIVPEVYRTMQLDLVAMRSRLEAAPREFSAPMEAAGVEIVLPLPYGGFGRFLVMESPIMEDGLAMKYPEIRTYVAQGIEDGTATARIDVTLRGFRAMVLSARGQFFIDPYWTDDTATYIAYYKRNLKPNGKSFTCGVPGKEFDPAELNALPPKGRPTGANLRTFRLAIGATAEYTAAVSGVSPGTKPQALSAIVTTVNRVSAVYERDLAIRLVLVANTDLLVFTDAAGDGYSNTNPSSLLSENQSKCDAVIGTANYDIGHVFSTGGGGLAGLGVVCRAGQKARGETGLGNPTGDPYDIDFVAHEMGHQFGGNHPFNGTSANCSGSNRNGATAYEVGSGTTIQAYAGICSPQDLAPNSDDYFHVISYIEMDAYTTTGLGSCATASQVATGNSPPAITPLTNRVIPSNTPFALTAVATDANGDALTYCWEEFDLGAAQNPTAAPRDNGSSPIFRSFDPSPSPTRLFPSLTYILNNANVPPATLPSGFISGEFLPITNRTMNFRVTVRDNRAGGGGSDFGSMTVQSVLAAGPFIITSQNSTATLAAGAEHHGPPGMWLAPPPTGSTAPTSRSPSRPMAASHSPSCSRKA